MRDIVNKIVKKQEEQLLKRIFLHLSAYKSNIVLLLCCFVVTASSSFALPLITKNITDQGMINKDFSLIVLFSIALLVAFSVNQCFNLFQTKIFLKIHNEFSLSLYKQVFEKLLRLPLSYYHDKTSTEIVSCVSVDVNQVAAITDQSILFSITNILQIISGLIGLLIIDWRLTLIVVAVVPAKYFIIKRLSNRKSILIAKSIESSRELNAWFGNTIGGIREIKLWNVFNLKTSQFVQLQKGVLNNHKDNAMLDKYNMSLETLIDIALNALLYILSGYFIVKGSLSIGSAFAFISYSTYVVGPIGMLLNIKYYIAQIVPSAKRLFDFLDLPEEEMDGLENHNKMEVSYEQNSPLINIKDLEFYYDKDRVLFSDVNLKIYKGEKIGIIGLNGTGKSTLINLLLGFYTPSSGIIEVDGKEISIWGMTKLRNLFAVVSQEIYLFQGTIEQNIDISEISSFENIELVCRKSGASKFIDAFPDRYQQYVGQNGAKLSGGEKQKIALSRALIKQANIIVLDEATSNYDTKSDEYLKKVITQNLSEKTILLISHKYELLKNLDRVFELKDGKIQEIDSVSLAKLNETKAVELTDTVGE
jgi:ABC-type multidrug transport system fused ATPase/permease subunit